MKNAHAGIKTIYIAELLSLFSAILLIIGIFLSGISESKDTNNLQINTSITIGLIIILFAGIGEVVSFIMNLFGTYIVGKDEPYFKKAFIWTLIGLIIILNRFFINNNDIIYSFVGIIINLSEMIIAYYALSGIIEIAKKNNNDKLCSLAIKSRTLVICIAISGAILNLISLLFNQNNEDTANLSLIIIILGLGTIIVIMSIIQYIIYLNALNKANKMINEIRL